MFSKILHARSSVLYCGTTPMPRRATAGAVTTSIPAIRTRPAVGKARVVQTLIVVVFPAPFGPSSPNSSPLANAKVDTVDGDYSLLAGINLLQPFNLYDHRGFISRRISDSMHWRFALSYQIRFKVQTRLSHAYHNLSKVRCCLHIRKGFPRLIERKNAVDDWMHLRLSDRSVHPFEHGTRTYIDSLDAELFMNNGSQCHSLRCRRSRQDANLRDRSANPGSTYRLAERARSTDLDDPICTPTPVISATHFDHSGRDL